MKNLARLWKDACFRTRFVQDTHLVEYSYDMVCLVNLYTLFLAVKCKELLF
jgi:hypothetical protein